MVLEAEMNTVKVISSNLQYWSKGDLLIPVLVTDAEMNTAEVILRNF